MPEEPLPIGPEVEYGVKRAQLFKHHADAVLEVKDRAVRAYGEMVLREIKYLVCCGWTKEEACLPAVNNLAIRRRDLQDELLGELGRLQRELREKLKHLSDELADELGDDTSGEPGKRRDGEE